MPITLTISDDFGKTLFTKDLIMGDPLAGPLLIQASNSVQSGTYNCLLDCGDEIFFSKILVE